MSTLETTSATFDTHVLASDVPVVVDFWAPWCGPCRAVAPVLASIATERADELRVVKVNIDEEPELAVRYDVASIPTILLFDAGEPVARTVGARSKRELEKALGLGQSATTATDEARTTRLERLLAHFGAERG